MSQDDTHRHDYVDHCVNALRRAGARVTRPRLAMLECLAGARQSLTPREVAAALRAVDGSPDVDQATVYRILEAFAQLGLVHRVGPEGGFVACDHVGCEAELHVVTYCLGCERTQEVDLPPELMRSVRRHVETTLRFRPGEHFFQLNGTCAECAGKDG